MRATNPLYRTELTLLEKLNDEDPEPSEAENMAWIKRFGASGRKTGNFDQSGPIYEITGPKEALQRLWTNYDAMSNTSYDPNEDYGIADEDNRWWNDYIEKVDADGDGDTLDTLAINEGKDIWDIINQLPKHLWGKVMEYFNDGIGTHIPNISAAGRLQYCVDCVRNDHPEINDSEDVNGDGDTDMTLADTNEDGNPDTAVVTADSKAEEKEAVKTAKEKLGIDEQTSTGVTKRGLGKKVVSDKNQKKKKGELLYDEEQDSGLVGWMKKMSPARNPKDKTVSDATQKNILRALTEHRF